MRAVKCDGHKSRYLIPYSPALLNANREDHSHIDKRMVVPTDVPLTD